APTPVEPPLPETLVNSVLSISFNTPDCLIVTIGTVCENQDTSPRYNSKATVIGLTLLDSEMADMTVSTHREQPETGANYTV
ncbi:hypothetical protein, partial [Aeromonas caviae]|uniref:hypothetical protein n=1 Tax=Aeromonas caviae TaxID=648 RepID=UPI0019D4A0CB